MQVQDSIALSIAPEFRPFVDAAITRFSYLYPDVELVAERETVIFKHFIGEPSAAMQDFRFTLYREKIHSETLALRHALIEGIMSR